MGKKQPIVFSAGHSIVSIDRLIELLKRADIQTVMDCRTKPHSRWRQFNHSVLAASLLRADIRYEWRGSNIGGLGDNVFFDETLDEIARRATDGERLVLLCSEGKPKDCHRGTILTPELENRGVAVEHLLYEPAQRASL
jgi:uncharacterized protein (DUF488 family)